MSALPQDPGPSLHPAVAGRERSLAALADEVRRLVELTVTNTAPPDVVAAIAERLRAAADALAAHVPDPPPPRFVVPSGPAAPSPGVPGAAAGGVPATDAGGMQRSMPYDPVVGRFNPLALPLALHAEPPRMVATARFSTAYEGAPGCVHGAVLAGAFDLVLTGANWLAGLAGPTVRLTLRFRRPTLLHAECRFEGEVTRVDERRVHSVGHVEQDGVVTVEATGEFAIFDHAEVATLRHRRGSRR